MDEVQIHARPPLAGHSVDEYPNRYGKPAATHPSITSSSKYGVQPFGKLGHSQAPVRPPPRFEDHFTYDEATNTVQLKDRNLHIFSSSAKSNHGNLVVGLGHRTSFCSNCIVGGQGNRASGKSHFVVGRMNFAGGHHNSVSGGLRNTAKGIASSILGGSRNIVDGNIDAIVGGMNNTVHSKGGIVVGGLKNKVTKNGLYATVVGGDSREATGETDTV